MMLSSLQELQDSIRYLSEHKKENAVIYNILFFTIVFRL